jgi:glycosyltransferase involved in cell wall biosynthesis
MDDIKKPFFTVAIPVYNRLEFTKQAVESVLNQTFKDFELLIVDDCSTDNSVWEYIKNIKDARVRTYKNEKNLGIVYNWKRCIELANGKWFRFLLNDDLLFKDSLEITEELIKDYPENKVIVTSGKDFQNIDDIKEFLTINKKKRNLPENILKNMVEIIKKRKRFIQTWAMPNSYTLLTEDLKQLIMTKKYQIVEENLGKTGHCVDYFILYAVAIKYNTMIEMDLPLYGVRYHETNLSKSYNQNLLYHLNGDKFVHKLLYDYKGFENFYFFSHAFYIYFNKIFSNKRKIFSRWLFIWTGQLIIFLFRHTFGLNPTLNMKSYA